VASWDSIPRAFLASGAAMMPALLMRMCRTIRRQEARRKCVDRLGNEQVETFHFHAIHARQRLACFVGRARRNDDRRTRFRESARRFQPYPGVAACHHGGYAIEAAIVDYLARRRRRAATGMDGSLFRSHDAPGYTLAKGKLKAEDLRHSQPDGARRPASGNRWLRADRPLDVTPIRAQVFRRD
jgi:hypothetical protein